MADYIQNILERNEKIVWRGKISRKVIVTVTIFWLIIILAISAYFFTKSTFDYTSNGVPKQTSGATIGIGVLVIGLILLFLYFFTNLIHEYAITNKRAIIKSGLIGTDYKSIHFDQIQSVDIDVGLIGKIFAVGNVKIDTGKTETYSSGGASVGNIQHNSIKTRTMYHVLKNIPEPYEVYKFLQSHATRRKESLYSGRADREFNPEYYQK